MTTATTTTARSMSDYAIEQAEQLLTDAGIPLTDDGAFYAALDRIMAGTS